MAQQLGYLYATGIGHDRGMTMAIGKIHLITHPKVDYAPKCGSFMLYIPPIMLYFKYPNIFDNVRTTMNDPNVRAGELKVRQSWQEGINGAHI